MKFSYQNEKLTPDPLEKNSTHTTRIASIENLTPLPLNSNYSPSTKLQKHLSGRALLLDEIPFPLTEIQDHYLNGYLYYSKGLTNHGKLECLRCGNTDHHLFGNMPCSRCHQACSYCRNCIMMGKVSECSPLVRWSGPNPKHMIDSPLDWDGVLSEGQKTASARVVEAVNKKCDVLVWAVCGAGKTEVLFQGINEALSLGLRVCIATPRTDVVLELVPRLRKVFPAIKPAALYGGSEERHEYSQLTIATTHQLFRFKKAFDVMIVDEVDAFPYSFDASLQRAVEKARKIDSSKILLTATPNQKLQRECKSGKQNYVTIPARYHRKPLPIPTFQWGGDWKKTFNKGKIPYPIKEWVVNRLEIKKQALIFFPDIEIMEKALPLFQTLHSKILSVHAEDPERKEKVQKMRDSEVPILLTTTILERGVTIPNIDVAVIGADDETFTESALVQISGRVGRSSKFPKGTITFFHFGRSRDMMKALFHIDNMNKQARKRGLMDE
ncbi:competence protein ComFA [Bacillus pakistanensis]|uniref:Competence protein ComFA n=1 Tax=Rossellomorea pakistanensis TaxID=992288 RepID=A0ABS2ND95_9BACI|nr:DEAD/DEAH box helicase [Bacillus pakistanensis]MBM7585788.1 competence protein ComFA [Bacillus pakistanensis]